MGSVFFVVGPVRGENLVGLAAEQEVEFLLEDAVELFEGLLIEIGHRPAAELEALGRILGRPAGRLHDAIHGNLGADDNLSHGSRSLFESGTNDLLLIIVTPLRPVSRRGWCGGCETELEADGHGVGAQSHRQPAYLDLIKRWIVPANEPETHRGVRSPDVPE